MAKNLGREFATMSEDERRKFAQEEEGNASDAVEALEFGDPRNSGRLGRQYGSLRQEIADPDSRDGVSALLDDNAHYRRVERSAARRGENNSMARAYGKDMAAEGWDLESVPWRGRGANVGRSERIASGVVGAALIMAGLRGRRLRGVLFPLGGGLVWRAVTGRCPVNRAIGRNSAGEPEMTSPVASVERGAGIKIETSVLIHRSREELYRFWRNFENLPRFMDHLESVTVVDEARSHWVVRGPLGARVEWDAEIHNDIRNELIAWRTLPGSDVSHAGSVHFEPEFPGPGTRVRVILRYEPPAGKSGDLIASMFGEAPNQQIEDDLRRFKQVMEASESGVSPVRDSQS
jgi:uncharacterized membrane protein